MAFIVNPVRSAYESPLSARDMNYLRNVLPKKVLESRKITFSVVTEDDFAADTTQYRVEWWEKGLSKHRAVSADLESLAQMLTAIVTMEQ